MDLNDEIRRKSTQPVFHPLTAFFPNKFSTSLYLYKKLEIFVPGGDYDEFPGENVDNILPPFTRKS